MSKTVLITGVTGMAGSHLAEYLLKEEPDFKIVGTKRSRSSLANIEQIRNKIELMDCDLTDFSGTLRTIEVSRPDYIFHLAAHSFVPDSWRAPHVTLMDNVVMQLNIFEAVRHVGLNSVIQVALSSEEFGRVLPDEMPITEKNMFRPLSPYAVSKVTQDMLAFQYFESYGMKVIRTRAFNHEGPRRGEMFVTSCFAKQIAEIEAGLKPAKVLVGNLSARRDWSDVRDVVRAYWLAVNHCVPGEDYNIASGVSRSVEEMLECLLGMSKMKIEVVLDQKRQRPSDVPDLLGDASKFRKTTGWKAEYTFEQTMADLLDYWRAQTRRIEAIKAP
jgi:GDP-4-dehydro-6-deoxy-D-mannose reductase